MKFFAGILAGLVLMVQISCATHRQLTDLQTQHAAESQEPETPPVVPLNPRTIELEIRVEISHIRVLKGDALRRDNLAHGIPAEAPPQLHLWSPAIIQRQGQTILDLALEGPMPKTIFVDSENQNRIFYWDLSPLLGKQDPIVIVRRAKVESHELIALIDSLNLGPYNPEDPAVKRNLQEEAFLERTPEIIRTAYRIVGGEENPYRKARMIFSWVKRNMRYQRHVPRRGAMAALSTLRGDSGQFADLFVALCRAVGVPARPVYGFLADQAPELQRHAWAEFYLPGHGWIPADPAAGKDAFGHLDNRRIVASAGRNIRLQYAPIWATYRNSEVENGRTPFMQVVTVVKSGIRAKIKSSARILSFGESVAGVVPPQDR